MSSLDQIRRFAVRALAALRAVKRKIDPTSPFASAADAVAAALRALARSGQQPDYPFGAASALLIALLSINLDDIPESAKNDWEIAQDLLLALSVYLLKAAAERKTQSP